MKIIIFTFYLISFSICVKATNNPVILEDGKEFYEIGLNLDILEDPGGKLKIEDVVAPKWSKKFKKSFKKNQNFGTTKSSFWIRLKVINKSKDHQSWLLTQNYVSQDEVTIFIKKGDKWKSVTTGDIFPFSSRDIDSRPFSFKLEIPDESIYFLKYKGSVIQVKLTMSTPTNFFVKETKSIYGWGIFFGLIFAMFIYNIFIFLSTKSLSYLYYSGYVLFFGLFFSGWFGFNQWIVFKNFSWFDNNTSLSLFAGLAEFFLCLFSISFLELRKNNKVFYKIMLFFSIVSLFIAISSFILPYSFNVKAFTVNIFLMFPVLMIIAIRKVLMNYRPAKYYLFAFSFMLAGTALNVLNVLGFIPSNFFTLYAGTIGNAIELMLLSMGLADRFNLIKEESLKLQENYAKELENEVAIKTKDLKEERDNVSNLLNNMNESIFTIDINCIIQEKAISEYSKEVFEADIAGKTIFDVLYPNIKSDDETHSKIWFGVDTCIGADSLQWEINKDLIPKGSSIKTSKGVRILEIRPDAIFSDDKSICKEIMFCIQDVTERESLKKEVAEREKIESKRNKILMEIAPAKQVNLEEHKLDLYNFFLSTEDLISEIYKISSVKNKKITKKEAKTLWRNLHTIKGNARTFRLHAISSLVHKKESFLSSIKFKEGEMIKSDFDEITKSVSEIKELINEYSEIAKDMFDIDLSKDLITDNISGAKIDDFKIILESKLPESQIKNSILEHLDNLYKNTIKDRFKSLSNMLETVAEEIGKDIFYEVNGDSFFLEEKEANILMDAVIHILRNSLDHGLEKKEERLNSGKEVVGKINVSLNKNNENIIIKVEDDGKGIDSNMIARKAIENGFITEEGYNSLSPKERLMIIFKEGFTTAENVSDLSGRGVGMDVVKTNIEKLGGVIDLDSVVGKGTTFFIKL
ncbi:ATP-binding protein [Bacteriovoracales bacterium]|nr:ATP-binding protein [Bacteriovoracales bacterium]